MRNQVKTNSKAKSSNLAVTPFQRERKQLTQALFRKSTEELVSDVLTELDAKNSAYEFIAASGLMNKFYQFKKVLNHES